jgi:hypothetical protein
MNLFGNDATVQTIIAERRNDVATVDKLQQNKQNGRERTGLRAVPSAGDPLSEGDKVGDFVYSSGYIYLAFTNESNVKQWGRIAITVS